MNSHNSSYLRHPWFSTLSSISIFITTLYLHNFIQKITIKLNIQPFSTHLYILLIVNQQKLSWQPLKVLKSYKSILLVQRIIQTHWEWIWVLHVEILFQRCFDRYLLWPLLDKSTHYFLTSICSYLLWNLTVIQLSTKLVLFKIIKVFSTTFTTSIDGFCVYNRHLVNYYIRIINLIQN
mgnify:CR=1 FL=1